MALNTDVGSSSADSMATLAEISAHLNNNYSEDAAFATWEDMTTAQQEDLCRQAALFFGYFPLRGAKVFTDPEQSMMFPRTSQTDQTIIPEDIKVIQAEILFNIILRAVISRTSPADGVASTAQVKKLGLGGLLSIEFASGGETSGSMMEQFTRSVTSLTWLRLRPYITQIRGGAV